MSSTPAHRLFRPGACAWAIVAFVIASVVVPATHAAAAGKIQGRIVATDTGEPVGFADILLVPADSTMRKVGGLTNADGTFLLEAAPGRYALQVRALSYARQRIEALE